MNKMPVLSGLDEKTVFGVSSQGADEGEEDGPTLGEENTSSPKGDSKATDQQFDI